MQYQYAPLQGEYKADPKEFFSKTSVEGQTTCVKNEGFLHCRFLLGLLSAWPCEG